MDLNELKNQIITNITCSKKIKVEYLELIKLDNFQSVEAYHHNIKYAVCIAVSVSGIRLIDNIIL